MQYGLTFTRRNGFACHTVIFLMLTVCVTIASLHYGFGESFKSVFIHHRGELLSTSAARNDSCLHYLLNELRTSCRRHSYEPNEVNQCLRQAVQQTGRPNYFVFYGDSRVREQYHVFVNLLSGRRYWDTDLWRHTMVEYRNVSLSLHVLYAWDNLIDVKLINMCRMFLQTPPSARPRFVVIGNVLWHLMKQADTLERGLQLYAETLKIAVPLFEQLFPTTLVIWMLEAPVIQFANGTQPRVDGIDCCHHTNVTVRSRCCPHWRRNDWINAYNDAVYRALGNSSVYIWKQSRMAGYRYTFDQFDGYHLLTWRGRLLVVSAGLYDRAQVLVNFYCNRYHSETEEGYTSKLCCGQPVTS